MKYAYPISFENPLVSPFDLAAVLNLDPPISVALSSKDSNQSSALHQSAHHALVTWVRFVLDAIRQLIFAFSHAIYAISS